MNHDDQTRRVQELTDQGWGARKIAKALGLTIWAVRRLRGWKRPGRGKGGAPPAHPTIQAMQRVRGASEPPAAPDAPLVRGLGPGEEESRAELWAGLEKLQQKVQARRERRADQRLIYRPDYYAIAFLSDTHFGSPHTDYMALKRDAEIIRDTPGMRAWFHGDGIDNYIVPKLLGKQREQGMPHSREVRAFCSWLEMILEKLDLVVAGNHDNWTIKASGIDVVREVVKRAHILYHPQQVFVKVCFGDVEQSRVMRRVLVRHKWRFNSVFNPTHGLEVGWDRGDYDYDWAIGGHTHIATLCRPFYRHGRMRSAILTGTYKLDDDFGEEVGFAGSQGRGCGAMILYPDGRELFVEDLETAAEFLAYLRSRERRTYR